MSSDLNKYASDSCNMKQGAGASRGMGREMCFTKQKTMANNKLELCCLVLIALHNLLLRMQTSCSLVPSLEAPLAPNMFLHSDIWEKFFFRCSIVSRTRRRRLLLSEREAGPLLATTTSAMLKWSVLSICCLRIKNKISAGWVRGAKRVFFVFFLFSGALSIFIHAANGLFWTMGAHEEHHRNETLGACLWHSFFFVVPLTHGAAANTRTVNFDAQRPQSNAARLIVTIALYIPIACDFREYEFIGELNATRKEVFFFVCNLCSIWYLLIFYFYKAIFFFDLVALLCLVVVFFGHEPESFI